MIRFVRPEIRNPISRLVLGEIEQVIEDRAAVNGARKIVFTGTSDVFASGADLREIAALVAEEARTFAERGQELMNRISQLAVPTVAAVNGFCFGGALDLALACRSRIGSRFATFCHPGARLGIVTGWGGTQRLPALVGEANALEMFFTAAPVPADEALRIGLIDRIADDPLSAALNS